ncbi:hypothetical protein GOV05_04070 [Candidatus Woesearchaeota archaeon]|nr:hypothetical protein [Candidatus Woesearchaeota archaeon]
MSKLFRSLSILLVLVLCIGFVTAAEENVSEKVKEIGVKAQGLPFDELWAGIDSIWTTLQYLQNTTTLDFTSIFSQLQNLSDSSESFENYTVDSFFDVYYQINLNANNTNDIIDALAAETAARVANDSQLQDNIDAIGNHTVDTDTVLTLAQIEAMGFVTGNHTIDTDTNTQLSQPDIEDMGFVTGEHTVDTDTNTQLSQPDIEDMGFVTGEHTVDTDTNTQLSEADVDAFVANNGYLTSYIDTNTQLTQGEIEAMDFVTGPHTVDTDTQLSEAQVDAFVANNGYLTSVDWSELSGIPAGFADGVDDNTLYDSEIIGLQGQIDSFFDITFVINNTLQNALLDIQSLWDTVVNLMPRVEHDSDVFSLNSRIELLEQQVADLQDCACSGVEECVVDADCPSVAPSCDNSLTCQGSSADGWCNNGVCELSVLADDSGCGASIQANNCGFYQPVYCNGQGDQNAPSCPTSCVEDFDCDSGTLCINNECVLDTGEGARACTDNEITNLDDCFISCGVDQNCQSTCLGTVSQVCADAYLDFMICAGNNGCINLACLIDFCPSEYELVYGAPGCVEDSDCAWSGVPCMESVCSSSFNCIDIPSTAGTQGPGCTGVANNDCDSPDTCDGAGGCQLNYEPNGMICNIDGTCNGVGICVDVTGAPYLVDLNGGDITLESYSTYTGTLTISEPAGPEGETVVLTTFGSINVAPPNVIVLNGMTQANFSITTWGVESATISGYTASDTSVVLTSVVTVSDTVPECAVDQCEINQVCYNVFEPNPLGVCQECDPSASPNSWVDTAIGTPGPGCSDATDSECTNPDTCGAGGTCNLNHEVDGTLCSIGTCLDGVCQQEYECAVDSDCGLCEKCDAGSCVAQQEGEDLKAECEGITCEGYYWGWSDDRCFERRDLPGISVACNGLGSCQIQEDICPLSSMGNEIIDCEDTCQAPTSGTCTGNTVGTCDDLNLGNLFCGIGECQNIVLQCVNGTPNTCTPLLPSEEICDGRDNNCDGTTDEDLTPPPPADKQDGVCSGAEKYCGGLIGWREPNYYSYSSDYESTENSCEGFDNDCDGTIDEMTQDNVWHCGACGNECSYTNAYPECVSGVCEFDQCVYGFATCDGNEANGCEVNLYQADNTCQAPIDLGYKCGDDGTVVLPVESFRGAKWFKIKLNECSIFDRDLKMDLRLMSQFKMNYDLNVYKDSCGGYPDYTSSSPGYADEISIVINDVAYSDDDTVFYIHVVYAGQENDMNACVDSTLTITANPS